VNLQSCGPRGIFRAVVVLLAVSLFGCSDPPTKGGNNGATNNGATNNGATNTGVVPPGSCPDAPPIPEGTPTCRVNEECPENLVCAYLPSDGVACGAACGPMNDCVSDDECTAPQICRTYTIDQSCCGPVPGNTQCDVPCEPDGCEAGNRCEEDGHCRPIPCDDGWDCGSALVCDGTRPTADEHGCALGDCEVDDITCPNTYVCDGTSTWKDSRNCAPVRCDAGFECPINFDCDPTAPVHGCVQRACEDDQACDCGACVRGVCHPRIFVCTELFAAPGG